MLPLAVFLLAYVNSGAAEAAAAEIQENPALMRILEAKTGPFLRCGKRALDARLASEAGSADLGTLSQDAAADLLTRAISKAAHDCDVQENAAKISSDIRNALPETYRSSAEDVARAYLYQLIGLSLFGAEP